MTKYLIILLAVVFPVHADVPKIVVDWLESNVVKVHAGKQTGTAWFIEPDLLVTSCHVTLPWKMVYISKGDGKKYPSYVLICDKKKDIALIKLYAGIPDSVRTTIAENTPRVGKTTYGGGYPGPLPLIIVQGIWQRQGSKKLDYSYINLSHAVNGDSGSPILIVEDNEVKVVTILEAVLNYGGQKYENLTFVLDPAVFREFLNENK